MVEVRFYEKPGCASNARQKALLVQAGHRVDARNLLAEPWTAERLRAFFAGLAVDQWFNRAAPRVKSGEIDPFAFGPEAALSLMVDDPLLIRRPLILADGWRCAGFDAVLVDRAIGLRLGEDQRETEGCAHGDSGRTCMPPA